MSALSPRGAAGADDVLELFEALQDTEIMPNSITYVAAIRAFGDKGDWEKAEEVRGVCMLCMLMLVEAFVVNGNAQNGSRGGSHGGAEGKGREGSASSGRTIGIYFVLLIYT